MNISYRILFSALALAATLCWQAPAFADPPSWTHGDAGRGQRQDRPDDRNGRYGDRQNGQDNRHGQGWGRDRDDHPYNNGYYAGARYPRYPVYPGYPVRPVYPAYPVYPRYPGYYYPSYYSFYYGVPVYRGYYGGPVYGGPVYGGPVYGGYGPCNPALGAAGAVTGAIIGNNASAPQNRGVGTVVGAIAGGIIGSAIGGCHP